MVSKQYKWITMTNSFNQMTIRLQEILLLREVSAAIEGDGKIGLLHRTLLQVWTGKLWEGTKMYDT